VLDPFRTGNGRSLELIVRPLEFSDCVEPLKEVNIKTRGSMNPVPIMVFSILPIVYRDDTPSINLAKLSGRSGTSRK
jgi:hypothetical protein